MVTVSINALSLIISHRPRRESICGSLIAMPVPELRDLLAINGGHRVPVVVFLSEDWFEVSRYGERTVSIYRRLAAEQLGPACPTGLVPPAAEALPPTRPNGWPSLNEPNSAAALTTAAE